MELDKVQKKNFKKPDKTVKAGRSTIETINLGNAVHKRIVFQPGWRWDVDVEPSVEGQLCSLWHVFLHVEGKLGIGMQDGSTFEFGPGDVSFVPPGHTAWTIGKVPAVVIDHTPPTLAVN